MNNKLVLSDEEWEIVKLVLTGERAELSGKTHNRIFTQDFRDMCIDRKKKVNDILQRMHACEISHHYGVGV